MVMCRDCDQEMNTAATCTAEVLAIRGVRYPRQRYRSASDTACHDCGVAPGGVHHHGCDMERCPTCAWQLISCGCGEDADGNEADVRAIVG